MSRSVSFVIISLVWAAIYLPWLGTLELRSEEGHRVLPAVEMLQSGDYLVPHVGGQPYLRKPPLVNWLVAAAFKISGVRNEWTARLPSTLFVLAAALAMFAVGRGVLSNRGALVAALAWLTNLGLMEKGRMIEIDAMYVSLAALALTCWLTWWQQRRSRWLTWVVPWIFLGLGMLAKGPAHLIFFYAVVIAVLWRARCTRELFASAHALGLLVMLAIFAAWAAPYLQAVQSHSVSGTWKAELALRITGGTNDATEWPMNFPRGFAYILPWLVLLPFVRPAKIADERQRQIATALMWAAAVPFVVILLLPGTIPRYILPTIIPVCWLIGMAVRDDAFAWSLGGRHLSINIPPRWAWAFVALSAAIATAGFYVRSAKILNSKQRVKPIAAQVSAAIPSGETLYAVNPLFQPYLFYVRVPVKYASTLDDLPPDAHYLVTFSGDKQKVEASTRWRVPPQVLLETQSYRGHSTLLFRVQQ